MVFKILPAAASFHAVAYNENKQERGHAENIYFENFCYLQDKNAAIKAFSSFYAVDYNENKQEAGQAEKTHHQNFSGISEKESITKQEIKKYFEEYSSKNSRIKNPQFHAILSCKGNEYSFTELKDHALKLMNRLGYSGNPMLIYEHRDTKNNHIHIVTSRVGPDGRKIDHNLEGKRANRILNEILKHDTKEELKQVLEKSLSYNISTIAQFKLLVEQKGYNVSEKDDKILFFRQGTGQGNISKKAVEDQIANRVIDTNRTRQIKAFIHKYKSTHDPAIVQDKNPNIRTAVKASYHSDLTNHLHATLGIQFVFHGEKNKDPYGYTIIDHKEKSVYKGSEVMKLEELRKPAMQQTVATEKKELEKLLKEQSISDTHKLKDQYSKPDKVSEDNKQPDKPQSHQEPKEREKSIIDTNYSLGNAISDTLKDSDEEATQRAKKKKRQQYRRKL